MPRKKPCTTFTDWINETGVNKVAKILGVYESTVRHWRNGFVLPRSHQMKRIKDITKGRVSYDAILEGSHSPLVK